MQQQFSNYFLSEVLAANKFTDQHYRFILQQLCQDCVPLFTKIVNSLKTMNIQLNLYYEYSIGLCLLCNFCSASLFYIKKRRTKTIIILMALQKFHFFLCFDQKCRVTTVKYGKKFQLIDKAMNQ